MYQIYLVVIRFTAKHCAGICRNPIWISTLHTVVLTVRKPAQLQTVVMRWNMYILQCVVWLKIWWYKDIQFYCH